MDIIKILFQSYQQQTDNSIALQFSANSIYCESQTETPTLKFLFFQLQEISTQLNQCFKNPIQQNISCSYESHTNEKQPRKIFNIIEFIKQQITTLSKEQQDLYYFVEKKKDKQLRAGIFKIPKQIDIVQSNEQSEEHSEEYQNAISELEEKIKFYQQQLGEQETQINLRNQKLLENIVITENSETLDRDRNKLKSSVKTLKTALRSSFRQRESLKKEILTLKNQIVINKGKFIKLIKSIKNITDESSNLKQMILLIQKKQFDINNQGIKEVQQKYQVVIGNQKRQITQLKQEIQNFHQLEVQESEKSKIIQQLYIKLEESQQCTIDLQKNFEKQFIEKEKELMDVNDQVNKMELKHQKKYSELNSLLEYQKNSYFQTENQLEQRLSIQVLESNQLSNQLELQKKLTMESDNELEKFKLDSAQLKRHLEEQNKQLLLESKQFRVDLLEQAKHIEDIKCKFDNLEEKSQNSQLQFNLNRQNTLHEEELGQSTVALEVEKLKSLELQGILHMFQKENEELKQSTQNQEKMSSDQQIILQEEISQQLLEIQQLLKEKQIMEQNLIQYAQNEYELQKKLEEFEDQAPKIERLEGFEKMNDMQISKQIRNSNDLAFNSNCSSIFGKKMQAFIDCSDQIDYSQHDVPEEIQQLQLSNMLLQQTNEELKSELIERESNENKLMQKIQFLSEKIKLSEVEMKKMESYTHIKKAFGMILQNLAEKNESELKHNFNVICSILNYLPQEKETLAQYTKTISKSNNSGLFQLFK